MDPVIVSDLETEYESTLGNPKHGDEGPTTVRREGRDGPFASRPPDDQQSLYEAPTQERVTLSVGFAAVPSLPSFIFFGLYFC